MAKYQADVQTLLRAIGGRGKYPGGVPLHDPDAVCAGGPGQGGHGGHRGHPGGKGDLYQAGQFQVIIGNDVAIFYNEFTACAGIEGVGKDAVKAAAQTNQSLLQRIMGTLGEIFAPIIPALICGGLILGFRNIIGEINFLGGGTQSLADVSPVLGRYVQLPVAHRRGGVPHAARGHRVVHHQKDGHHPDSGHHPGPDSGVPQLLNGFSVPPPPWRTSPCGTSALSDPDDRLSGPGHRRHAGRLCAGVSGEVL